MHSHSFNYIFSSRESRECFAVATVRVACVVSHSLRALTSAYGLRALVGDDKFQDLLQIRAGNSLVFVIDTTGSMGKDIAAVMNKTKEIVQETRGTPNAPYNYILVTFNDPGK